MIKNSNLNAYPSVASMLKYDLGQYQELVLVQSIWFSRPLLMWLSDNYSAGEMKIHPVRVVSGLSNSVVIIEASPIYGSRLARAYEDKSDFRDQVFKIASLYV